ncbi:16617_t:CDS:1, partial [Entrophospora sp. SA101]
DPLKTWEMYEQYKASRSLEKTFIPDQAFELKLFTSIIDRYSKKGEMKIAEHYFKKMIENLIPPDVITFTTLIHGYKIKKDPSMIKYTLKEMDGFGIDIDKFLFTTLIYSYLQNNDLTNAFKIYQKI